MNCLLEFLNNNSIAVGFGVLAATSLGFGIYKYRKWVGGGVCHSKATLTGKTVIITGANAGIGLETAVDLAKRGARVILACRSEERGEKAAVLIRRKTGNQNVIFAKLDLSSLDSVRVAAEAILQQEPRIDVLVNNAGVVLPAYQKTKDGFEAHFGVNHLGHFLFTNLLLSRIKESPSARIVTLSSNQYKQCSDFDFTSLNSSNPARYSTKMPGAAYSQSKLANIMFSRSLSKRLEGTGVSTFAVRPGVVLTTEIAREFLRYQTLLKRILFKVVAYLLSKTPWQGAQTTIYCAVAEELEGVSGRFYDNCCEVPLETAIASNDEVAEELWRVSAEMVGLETR